MKSNIFFHDKVVMRIPALSQKSGLSLDQIKILLDDPRILEAIYVASPSLSLEIEKWKKDNLR